MQMASSSYYYQNKPDPSEPLLRRHLQELAAERIRFGYRRPTIMLRREGWRVNAKRVYRLYREEGLGLSRKHKKKRPAKARAPLEAPVRSNQLWAMDFVAERFEIRRWFRILTSIVAYTRKALLVWPQPHMSGQKVAQCLSRLCAKRGTPQSIRVDNGSEF
ncbi:MAG: hypothetical protein SynsKO_22490 [Synoicihabitans sp.]